jgi:hypothetical protein
MVSGIGKSPLCPHLSGLAARRTAFCEIKMPESAIFVAVCAPRWGQPSLWKHHAKGQPLPLGQIIDGPQSSGKNLVARIDE